jgi:3-oxoacyl-[acyl-carrier-protein] synthase III
MDLLFKNKRISGILTVLPKNESSFDDEMENYNFSIAKSKKLKIAMGYDKHRVVDDGVCVSDLCLFGLNYLINNGLLKKEDIDALILVTQSPDHFMPPTSNIIQGALGLKQDMICMDINQGCAGYILGLIQSFSLLNQPSIKKVVLLNADVLSRKTSKRDRNSYPLIGDGASITIVETTNEEQTVYGSIKVDGSHANALMILAGAFKMPSTPETAEMKEDETGNFRSLDNLVMQGDDVFNFVQREVPPMIHDLLGRAGVTKEQVDAYMFHQPNRFMLQKLADGIGVSRDKMPSNIVGLFGNASGVTIPTDICYNIGNKLETEEQLLCLAGFGVGLTWGSLLIKMNNLSFCKMIDF